MGEYLALAGEFYHTGSHANVPPRRDQIREMNVSISGITLPLFIEYRPEKHPRVDTSSDTNRIRKSIRMTPATVDSFHHPHDTSPASTSSSPTKTYSHNKENLIRFQHVNSSAWR